MEVVVARIGRPHGVRGEVSIEVRTDSPESRFVPRARFDTDPPSVGPLTLASARDHNGVLLLTFDEVGDRTAAEGLRDTLLLAKADLEPEEDAWYDHELLGLTAKLPTGQVVGAVVGLEHGAAQDLLVIREGGHDVRLPFVKALVPTVDVPGGLVVIDPPGGLFAAVPGDAPSEDDAGDDGS